MAIKTEQLTINDMEFTRTYSDAGFMVERDGIRYSDAIDPAYLGRTYIETDVPIETDEHLDPEAPGENENTTIDPEELNMLKEKAMAYDIIMGVSE